MPAHRRQPARVATLSRRLDRLDLLALDDVAAALGFSSRTLRRLRDQPDRALPAVYCSLDPATCIVEAAVHRGFGVLDTQPQVLSCLQFDAAGIVVVQPDDLPNPAWLQGGVPGAGLLATHGIVVLPSAVSKRSWNLVFAPGVAAGRWHLLHQEPLVLDTRLNPPLPSTRLV